MKATRGTDVEIERRCDMVTGASCGHVSLSWIPGNGRHGVRTWVLSTDDGGTIRRIRLSPPAKSAVWRAFSKQSRIREAAMTNPLDESAVPLILDEPKHGRVGGYR